MEKFDDDEVDSFYELLGVIFLALFCVFAIAYMGTKMSKMITRYHHRDKIETVANAAEVSSPFTYTGYQAYMFAWMMDPYSDVSITWMSNESARTDGLDNDHITLGTLDESGSVISNFISYRNQLITGGHLAPDVNVKNVIKNVHPDRVHALYAHDGSKCGHMFTLIFTGDYTNNEKPYYAPNGTTIFDRRKQYSWIILSK